MGFFSTNLRFLRNSRHLSQEAFAGAVGLNRGNVASYEKGLAEPNSTRLLKIARFFHIPLETLIEVDLKSNPQDFSAEKASLRPTFSSIQIQAMKEEVSRLGRIISGLREFHALRGAEEVTTPASMQSLQVDHERLIDASSKMQELMQQLADAYL